MAAGLQGKTAIVTAAAQGMGRQRKQVRMAE